MRRIAAIISRSVRPTKAAIGAGLIAHTLLLSGCSSFGGPSTSTSAWLDSGSLALSRPVPLASRVKPGTPNIRQYPVEGAEIAQIIISRTDKTITAIQPGSSPMVFKSEGAQYLSTGSFSVTLKEDKPLWYAPNTYFVNRSLEVPDQGSRSRFMRAALGRRALYLNDQTPIHCGPVWLQEIGGVRLRQSEMDQLYSMVNVGTRVEIR